jgi:hypothetical protein
MLNTQTHEHCTYTHLPNGVHRFVFTSSSPEAVDEWITHLEKLYANSSRKRVLRILVDSREVAGQPLDYASERSREMNARFPNRPPTRTAFLYSAIFLESLARTFIIMLSRIDMDKVQFFPGDSREADAMAWLVGNK